MNLSIRWIPTAASSRGERGRRERDAAYTTARRKKTWNTLPRRGENPRGGEKGGEEVRMRNVSVWVYIRFVHPRREMLGSSSRPGSSWLAARFLVQPNRPRCRQSRDVAFLRMPYRTARWEKEREEKRRSGCQSLGRIVWEIVKGEALSRKGAHRYRARARSVTSELRLVSTPRRRYVIIARGGVFALVVSMIHRSLSRVSLSDLGESAPHRMFDWIRRLLGSL